LKKNSQAKSGVGATTKGGKRVGNDRKIKGLLDVFTKTGRGFAPEQRGIMEKNKPHSGLN